MYWCRYGIYVVCFCVKSWLNHVKLRCDEPPDLSMYVCVCVVIVYWLANMGNICIPVCLCCPGAKLRYFSAQKKSDPMLKKEVSLFLVSYPIYGITHY